MFCTVNGFKKYHAPFIVTPPRSYATLLPLTMGNTIIYRDNSNPGVCNLYSSSFCPQRTLLSMCGTIMLSRRYL